MGFPRFLKMSNIYDSPCLLGLLVCFGQGYEEL